MPLSSSDPAAGRAQDASRPQESSSYPHYSVSALVPGPKRARFTGTVVNIFSFKTTSSAPMAAKGCIRLLLRDRGCDILVKLWFADTPYDNIVLGTRVTVAVTHVSTAVRSGMSPEALTNVPANLMVSVFPERDAGCAVSVEKTEDSNSESNRVGGASALMGQCVTDMDAVHERPGQFFQDRIGELGVNLDGLIDLDAFANGAAADRAPAEVKLMMAVVEVGQVKQVTKRDKTTFETIPLRVVDQSCLTTLPNQSRGSQRNMSPLRDRCGISNVLQPDHPEQTVTDCELSLSISLAASCQRFDLPTVLVLTYPKLQSQSKRRIRPTSCSQLYVDPFGFIEAQALRRWAKRLIWRPLILSGLIDDFAQKIEKNQVNSPSGMERGPKSKRLSLGPNTYDTESSRYGKSGTSEQRQLVKSQYTLSLFIAQIQLQPAKPIKAYISVLITQLNLVSLWESEGLFVGICCGNFCQSTVLGNLPMRMTCESCGRTRQEAEKPDLEGQPCFNPQLLGGFADEEAGYGVGRMLSASRSSVSQEERKMLGHNLLLTNGAVYSLTGLQKSDFDTATTRMETDRSLMHPRQPFSLADDDLIKARLRGIEDVLLWTRVTLVLGWTGEQAAGLDDGKVVVLEVII